MISWRTILYGAALTFALVAVAGWLIARRPATALTVAAASAAGAIAWNAILHSTGGQGFFVDARISVFPASWQDTGSGVFALAASALALGLGPQRASPAATTTRLAALAAVVAFAVDVYLYCATASPTGGSTRGGRVPALEESRAHVTRRWGALGDDPLRGRRKRRRACRRVALRDLGR